MVEIRDVPNIGFRLFGRIRIVLWTIRPNTDTNTNSWMTRNIVIFLILIILWIIYQRNNVKKSKWSNKVTWSIGNIGLEEHKSFDVFSTGEFCCQSTCHQLFVFVMMTLFSRIRIDYSPLFGTEANTNRIFGTSLVEMLCSKTHNCSGFVLIVSVLK